LQRSRCVLAMVVLGVALVRKLVGLLRSVPVLWMQWLWWLLVGGIALGWIQILVMCLQC